MKASTYTVETWNKKYENVYNQPVFVHLINVLSIFIKNLYKKD